MDTTDQVIINEYSDKLNRILKENSRLPELGYFLGITCKHLSDIGSVNPAVAMLGTNIPEELIFAAGAAPYWITGGSHASAVWSDELLPRDTDPVSRSLLGFIHQPGADFSDTLFIVPLTGDSMRKIAYELRSEGRKLCLVDIPPERSASAAVKVQEQLLAMTAAVSKHTGVRVTKRTVISAERTVSRARTALRRFNDISRERSDLITDTARLLVRDSYYMSDSIGEWTFRLELLTRKIKELSGRTADRSSARPKVLLMGSPVIFPNYKVPFLIGDTGLSVLETVDSAALKNFILCGKKNQRGNRNSVIRCIASDWQGYDASASYIKNDALYNYVSWLTEKGGIEGVVYHVLKGQIEYDFELERFEMLFASCGIPLFRLETDYQYQDIEQLRIRMEAFSEMLAHNRLQEVKKAL